MALTRRRVLAGMAMGASGALAQQAAQQTPAQPAPPIRAKQPSKPRTTPAVCLYSKQIVKVEYENLGMVLRDMGFDGCDLSVEPGGHVTPDQVTADLMRAIEAVNGVGLDVPILSTSIVAANDPNGRQLMGIAGFMQIPLIRPGYWRYNNAPDLDARLAEVQRDLMALASVARAYNIATCLHNRAGDYVGASIWDVNSIFRGIDPRWVGYDFDPGYAAEQSGIEGGAVALRLALPRTKAVTVKDFYWAKDGATWKAAGCPLGEGMVDWTAFFSALARVRFVGPISISMTYQPKDEINAIRRDLEFVRKQIAAAYPKAA
jgi:sugar phosphate isomerase/epimerase